MNGLDFGTAIGLIKGLGSPDPAVIEGAVSDWLDDHPEATTTVQDGSITKAKLDSNLQGTVDDVADLKSAVTGLNSRMALIDGVPDLQWVKGIVNFTNGVASLDYSNYLLRSSLVAISDIKSVSTTEGYKFRCAFINSDKTTGMYGSWGSLTPPLSSAVYVYITLSKDPVALIDPSDASNITVVYNSLSDEVADKLNKPSVAGTDGQVLTSDGNGGQSWEDPAATVVVDPTLTISGDAADAKATGDMINTLTDRVAAIDGEIEPGWVKGTVNFTNRVASLINSNYILRTSLLTLSDIKSVSVATGYHYRCAFINADKTTGAFGSWNSMTPTADTQVYAYILLSRDPSDLIDVDEASNLVIEFESKIDNKVDKYQGTNNAGKLLIVNNNGRVVVSDIMQADPTLSVQFESGAMAYADGSLVNSTIWIRTVMPYPAETVYSVSANDGFRVCVFTFDSDYGYLGYTTLSPGFGTNVFAFANNVKYVRFTVQASDSTAPDPDDVGFVLSGPMDAFAVQESRLYDRNFLNANKSSLSAAYSALGGSPTVALTATFGAVAITDLHDQYTALDDAHVLQAKLETHFNYALPLVGFGDFFAGVAKENGAMITKYSEFIAKAQSYGMFYCVGQHECGFYDTLSGRSKAKCLSHTEVFNEFISPMKTVWGLPDLDTIWYYKDFSTEKIRLISLYQYNQPLIDGESADVYKYARSLVWYGSDQLAWLAQTLNSVPDGYRVIIMMHEPDGTVTDAFNSEFFTSSIAPGNYIIDGHPIIDILDAYTGRTAINQTYHAANTIAYPTTDFEMSITADFANANGTFANFFHGDAHIDCVGKVSGYISIGLTATSRQSYDCQLISETSPDFYSKSAAAGNNPASSIVQVYGYCPAMIRMARVGQQYALTGQTRIFEAIPTT